MISLLKTITNTKLQLLGFRVSFLTYYSSREQFSTNLTFLGAQNLIGWAPEITGQLLSDNTQLGAFDEKKYFVTTPTQSQSNLNLHCCWV